MKIGIDLDDVLAAFNAGWIKYYNKKYGTNYKFSDITSFYFDFIKENIPKDEVLKSVYDFYDDNSFEEIVVIDHAKEAISKLKDKHQLFVITSRKDGIKEKTIKWLDKNFPNSFQAIILTNQFTNEANAQPITKGQVCLNLGIDIMVEDATHFAEEISSKGIKTFLLDNPWNQDANESKNLIRVKSWQEILEYVEQQNL